jgi:rubrerythrin
MGEEHLDTRLLTELTTQSQDLNSDAVRITRRALDEFTRERHERTAGRRHRPGLLGALAAGAVLFGSGRAAAASGSPSASGSAGTSDDVMALQTAASIENLAVQVYAKAAALSFVQSGNATVKTFITTTGEQHSQHAKAFNAAITQAGGQPQNAVDPKYNAVVQQALPGLTSAADVVKLALTLEDVAAQTYTKYVSLVSDASLRTLFGSVAPVEAQHRTVLLTVQALLAGQDADLIAIPTQPDKLPAAIGSVGIPDTFYPTTKASPISEGAVQ